MIIGDLDKIQILQSLIVWNDLEKINLLSNFTLLLRSRFLILAEILSLNKFVVFIGHCQIVIT